MTQNHATIRRIEALRQLPQGTQTLRDETERALGDIAYVLHLTNRVKQAIVEEKACVAAK